MTAISIVLAWLVVGFLLAVMFGVTARNTHQGHEEEEVPQRRGANVRFWRKAKGAHCQIASSMAATTSSPTVKKHGARHHAA